MRSNLATRVAACVGVAAAVAIIGWWPDGGSGNAGAVTTGPPSVVVKLPATGTGLNGGKDVRVRVDVTCAHAAPGAVTVHVTQKRAAKTITGSGVSSTNYTCNGHTQHAAALVHASKGFYTPGAATATANVTVCNGANCVSGQDARDISLVAPRTTTTVGSTTSST